MCDQASAVYRLLGDEARLRLLRVLGQERLNVTELTGILGLAQSGVSRHLKLLKDAGFVVEEKDAGFTLLPAGGPRERAGWRRSGRRCEDQFERSASDPAVKADGARLQEVLRLRKENFEQHAVDSRDGRQLVPGRSWAAWSRALGMLLPPLRVADLGCGEGYLTIETSRWASTVIGVDRSEAVLARARALGRRRRATNVTWRRGELEKLPIDDESVDVALLSQALHHAADPARAVAEAARITAPGGRVLILDLREHQEEWVRAKLGDRVAWVSRKSSSRRCCSRAGWNRPRTRIGSSRAGDPFAVLIAAASKPRQHAAVAERRSASMTTTSSPVTDISDACAPPAGHPLRKILEQRIAIIDGAMGTTIRTYGMTEADIRGERFKDSKKDLLNNGDLFSLTQPKMICDIHRRFLEAGADIIETNTFGATSITPERVLRRRSARARRPQGPGVLPEDHRGPVPQRPRLGDQRAVGAAVPRVGGPRRATPTGRQRFVAGAIGPLTVSLSNSPDADDAGFRVVTFDQVKAAYVAAGPRADRRRLGPAAGRDDLRLAQRQGGARRDPGGVRCRTATSCRS